MASERISRDSCSISRRWKIHPDLARMLIALQDMASDVFSSQGLRFPGLWIISGFRSPALQAQINPAAPDSLHTRCPSMAVDLRVGNLPASTTPEFWPVLGTLWRSLGGRWGGDFRPNPDVNHFEMLAVSVGPFEI